MHVLGDTLGGLDPRMAVGNALEEKRGQDVAADFGGVGLVLLAHDIENKDEAVGGRVVPRAVVVGIVDGAGAGSGQPSMR